MATLSGDETPTFPWEAGKFRVRSFSPWMGCQRISPGCEGCYAEAWAKATQAVTWGAHGARKRMPASAWAAPQKWAREAREDGIRTYVYSAEHCDLFDRKAPAGARDDFWRLIRETPDLTWFLLTKLPQNIAEMLPETWGRGWPNVWLGISAEDQAHFDRRWPILAATPAAVRWVSYMPALGPLKLGRARPEWVIWGDDSSQAGYAARPTNPEWIFALAEECAAAGIPLVARPNPIGFDEAAGGDALVAR
jgi:protein gp37